MEINQEAISWLENEGSPPVVDASGEYVPGEYARWQEAWDAHDWRPPRGVWHHALIEDFDIVPDWDDPYVWYLVPDRGEVMFYDTWLDLAEVGDRTTDALGPSYSQAFADKHQSGVRDVPCARVEGSGSSAGGPGKCGQNDGGHFSATDRRDRQHQVEDASAGGSGSDPYGIATALDCRPWPVRRARRAGHASEVPEGS